MPADRAEKDSDHFQKFFLESKTQKNCEIILTKNILSIIIAIIIQKSDLSEQKVRGNVGKGGAKVALKMRKGERL